VYEIVYEIRACRADQRGGCQGEVGNSYQQVLGSYPSVGSNLSRGGRADFGAAGRMADPGDPYGDP
jgi:hypothetical protein